MAKVWVLDTETKGTGAQMVPLEKVVQERRSGPEPRFVFERAERPAPEAEERAPREFRVVDLMTREVLADGADARTAVAALESVRKLADAAVYVWDDNAARWRMLTLGETRALWGFRGRADQPAPSP